MSPPTIYMYVCRHTDELVRTGRSVALASFVDQHLAAVSARRKKSGHRRAPQPVSTLATETTATTSGTMITDGDTTFGGGTLVLAQAGGTHRTAASDEESFRTYVVCLRNWVGGWLVVRLSAKHAYLLSLIHI